MFERRRPDVGSQFHSCLLGQFAQLTGFAQHAEATIATSWLTGPTVSEEIS
jgi:hypothetical protein